jgi:hypothetical protein
MTSLSCDTVEVASEVRFEVDYWTRRWDDLDVVEGLGFHLEYARSIRYFHLGLKG